MDFFNVFNVAGNPLPHSSMGILSLRTSDNGARQLQWTLRLNWQASQAARLAFVTSETRFSGQNRRFSGSAQESVMGRRLFRCTRRACYMLAANQEVQE